MGASKEGRHPTGVSSQKGSCQNCKGGMTETTYVSPDDLSSGVIATMCGGMAYGVRRGKVRRLGARMGVSRIWRPPERI